MKDKAMPAELGCGEAKKVKKVLYAASTVSHLRRFHMPYLEGLRQDYQVLTMANGEGADFSVPFQKSFFSPKNFGALMKIRGILKGERFDAVILNTSLAAFLIRAAMLGMRRRPRVLNIAHGYLFDCPPRGRKDRILLLCERTVAGKTDEIAVMNQADLSFLMEKRLCGGKVHFMRGMGYTVRRENAQADAALRCEMAEDGEFLLTFVGELSRRKNQEFLIHCVKRLRDEGLPVRLMLVGEGSERKNLEEQIQALGLEGIVTLTGNREPIAPYLAITDLYVSASRIEGLPFNMMEAMEYGLPIVASDCKGQTDLLADHPDSLYPREDEEAFCRRVMAAVEADLRGCGAVAYPLLADYTLEAVYTENLNLMKGFLNHE